MLPERLDVAYGMGQTNEPETPAVDPHPLGRKIGFLLVCLLVGGASSLVTRPEIPHWYAQLHKPPFTPPPWLFGPVWTLIYILLALTAAQTWYAPPNNRGPRHLQRYLAGAILGANALWSLLFFGLHRPDLALLDIGAYLLLLLLWVRWLSQNLALRFAWLQALHVVWILFATVLNFSVWWLNR